MISLAHYRNMQIFKTVNDFHDALVDKNFRPRQKFIYQRDQLDALADLRDLAVNGFSLTQSVINFAQNFFQRGVRVADSSIKRVAGVQSAQN